MCRAGDACRSARSQRSLNFRGDGRDLWQPSNGMPLTCRSSLSPLCTTSVYLSVSRTLAWPCTGLNSERKMSFPQRKTNTTQAGMICVAIDSCGHVCQLAHCSALKATVKSHKEHLLNLVFRVNMEKSALPFLVVDSACSSVRLNVKG